jgi:hypothetical protein
MTGQYTQWLLDTGNTLYHAGGIHWRKYNGALVPADATPVFITLTQHEQKQLLRQSKALCLRYSSDPSTEETQWWFVVCQHYDTASLSGNTRSKINRGNKRCEVRQLDSNWFFENGYSCYRSAYHRYVNTQPINETAFKKSIAEKQAGPFEWWGVYVGNELAGYCECIIEEKEVSTNIIKFNPDYFKQYTSYALLDKILSHYSQKDKIISNGNRSIAHDTNMQEFLMKLGFTNAFCNLNVIYQPYLSAIVRTIYPGRDLINNIPDSALLVRLKALLLQEEIVRSCHG